MNDRRLLAALALIMLIAFVPTFLLKRPAPKAPLAAATTDTVTPPVAAAPAAASPAVVSQPDSVPTPAAPEDTVVIRSKLYRYAVSTRGGRIVSSRFLRYRSLAAADHGDTLELVPRGEGLLAGTLISGRDTLRFDQIAFTASADSLNATSAPATLTLHGQSGAYGVDLSYRFSATDYQVSVTGQVTGLGPAGGTLLVGLGNGFRATEASPQDNFIQSGIVTKLEKTSVHIVQQAQAATGDDAQRSVRMGRGEVEVFRCRHVRLRLVREPGREGEDRRGARVRG